MPYRLQRKFQTLPGILIDIHTAISSNHAILSGTLFDLYGTY